MITINPPKAIFTQVAYENKKVAYVYINNNRYLDDCLIRPL